MRLEANETWHGSASFRKFHCNKHKSLNPGFHPKNRLLGKRQAPSRKPKLEIDKKEERRFSAHLARVLF
jgi:hypothetical protein